MPNNFIEYLIESFSKENLIAFFRSKISSFSVESEDLRFLFTEDKFKKYSSIDKIGEATIASDELIIICSKTTDPITERTGKKRQYDIAKKVLKQEVKDAAFFIFYDNDGNFRFSFVRANYLGNKRDFTDFKRYTYFVSPTLTNNTFKRQIESCNFTTLDEIIEAFSVEPLNKQFYQEIAKAFYTLIGGTVKINSRNIEYSNVMHLPSTPIATNRKIYQEFAVRLIGRTIFCWFLKNKKSENEIPLVPESWLSSKAVERIIEEKNNYYHSILEKLFFLVLNRKISERAGFLLPDEHELIPFLNGGLFDPHINDFFIADQPNYALEIPNKWFLELFEVLEQFNFTIDENSIFDAEVSIDPEMLGTIFENLLAEIDPDTEKSARNATGSFYTPREIVDYMVEQSLIQYLKTNTGITDNDSLTQLFKEGGENKFDNEDTETILKAISKVKILDPACGSGAFPMGAVSKIILALKKLDPGAKWWREQQVSAVPNAIARKKLKEKLDAATSDYARKLGVIQNSIYGVDIQPIAAEISKLRSFLSLVIDENIDDNAVNRGIEPLPNLEFKFVTANTLIDLAEKEELKGQTRMDFGETETLQVKLQEIRNSYLQAYGEDKETLKKEFKDTQNEIFNHEVSGSGGALNKRALQLAAWNPFGNESSGWFNPEWMFGVDKFDIVIGNPPYGFRTVLNKAEKEFFRRQKSIVFSSGDSAELFSKICFDKFVLENGILSFIVPKKSLYGEAWNDMRVSYWQKYNLVFIMDTGKSFANVLLEASVFGLQKTKQMNDVYLCVFDKRKNISNINTVKKEEVFLENNTAQIYKNLYSKELWSKIKDRKQEQPAINGVLGLAIGSDFFSNTVQKYKLLKGIDIERYKVRSNRYLKNEKNLNWENAKVFLKPKVLSQVIVSHIDNPYPHLKITSCYDNEGVLITNTIMSFEILNNSISEKFLVAYLNSKFVSWYAYNFIYARAIRTMHFYNYYIQQLPIPKITENTLLLIEKNVDNINQSKCHNMGISEFEQNNDSIFFKLYNLSYQEVKLIDPEFPLSQTEYENYNIDEQ
jgi:adenine-specific DNA-methyltransferase